MGRYKKTMIRICFLVAILVYGVIVTTLHENKYKKEFRKYEYFGIIDSIKNVPEDKGADHYYVAGKWLDSITSHSDGMYSEMIGDSIAKLKGEDFVRQYRKRKGVFVEVYPYHLHHK